MSRIDPEKDFAGFVEERLDRADEYGWRGVMLTEYFSDEFDDDALPSNIPNLERIARQFDLAAAEIRAIAKSIRCKHGITADDEIRRKREAVEERRQSR